MREDTCCPYPKDKCKKCGKNIRFSVRTGKITHRCLKPEKKFMYPTEKEIKYLRSGKFRSEVSQWK